MTEGRAAGVAHTEERQTMQDKSKTAPTLGTAQSTIDMIQKHQFRFRKQFGQNFLIDPHVLEKIVTAAEVGEDDVVLEIGPGIGTLTQHLAHRAKRVIAVEIDRDLIPILQETMENYPNVRLIHADVLKIDIHEIVRQECDGRPIKIVANLPYYITTPIIMGLFEKHVPIRSMTVMVQKEVALRMQASPGGKDYGALSLAVQYYAKPYLAANVPAHCFMPRPKVGSAVIRLTCHDTPPVGVESETMLFSLIRAAFHQRRKTLVNGMSHYPELQLTKEEAAQCVAQAGLPATVRGETLSLEQFAKLSDVLCRYREDSK